MKRFQTLSMALALILLAGSSSLLRAQEDGNVGLPEDQMNSSLVYEFDKDFDVVFEGVQKGLVDAGYEVEYASKKKKLIETKFRILAEDKDFFDIMEQYGKVPYVRSPKFKNGRTLVTVKLEETTTGKVSITVSAEMSAYEERFLNKWLYWASNGVIEEEAMQSIIAAVDSSSGSDL